MLSEKFEDYSLLWMEPNRHFLIANPKLSDKTTSIQSTYLIYRRHAMSISRVLVAKNLIENVIKKMLSVGVEVKSESIDLIEEFRVERLWADRAEEFTLIPDKRNSNNFYIFHKEFEEYVLLDQLDDEAYRKIVQNMINAGVEKMNK
ncbi:MAG: hypothetical protein ACFE0Q_08995 [Anaerolineae bacterium]